MIKNLFFLLSFLTFSGVHGQDEVRFCGQPEATAKLFAEHPESVRDAEMAEKLLESTVPSERVGGGTLYIVPVVFHVIHDNGEENISDEQILSAMEWVNIDYRKLNPDVDFVVPEFAGITADIEIEFRLAQLDPNGNCTNGITRTVSNLTYEGNQDMKDLIQWPRNKYLNVWVCSYANGAAGYSLYPSSVNSFTNSGADGIVLKHDYCGYLGTSTWSHRRTFTHEIGHWLNLRHCWGNSNSPGLGENCSEDDLVNDTPLSIGWQSCNLSGESCGGLNNVQNYMEYSGCGRMFTEGQKTRMRTAIESNIAQRNQLWQQSNLEATGVWSGESILCQADFSASDEVVCPEVELQFFDESFNAPNFWSWDFGDGSILEGSDPEIYKDPVHSYALPGQYSVSLTVSGGSNELSEQKQNFINVLAAGATTEELVEGFEDNFPGDGWWVENEDGGPTWHITDVVWYSGDQCLKLNNYSNQDLYNTDSFLSTTFDFAGEEEIYIYYKWAYANKLNATNDRLRIYISDDCGQTWILKEQHAGNIDLPSADATNSVFEPQSQWDWNSGLVVVDNTNQLNDHFRVKFVFIGYGGNNIYLDDINILGATDVGVADISNEKTVRLYPNPTGETFWLECLNFNQEVTTSVFDLTGRKVQSLSKRYMGKKSTAEIDVNQLSEGVYYVVLAGSDFQITRSVVVTR